VNELDLEQAALDPMHDNDHNPDAEHGKLGEPVQACAPRRAVRVLRPPYWALAHGHSASQGRSTDSARSAGGPSARAGFPLRPSQRDCFASLQATTTPLRTGRGRRLRG
jgi:hypothetical protein